MQKELDLAVYITCGTNKNKRLNNSTVKRWQNRENTWENKKKNKKEKKKKEKEEEKERKRRKQRKQWVGPLHDYYYIDT